MDAPTQASFILSKLKDYDFDDIYSLFSDFLQPFSTKSQNPNKKPSRTKKPSTSSTSSSIRSLAKTFDVFVKPCLSLLPKLLWDSSKHPKTSEFVNQLFDCYKLCLNCLEIMSSELAGASYSVHLQRGRYVDCLMRWEKYEDAIDEGFRVLKDLGGVKFEGCRWKVSIGKLLPVLNDCNVDKDGKVDGDFALLIVRLAVTVAQSVSLSKVKDAHQYNHLLILLKEVQPWFGCVFGLH